MSPSIPAYLQFARRDSAQLQCRLERQLQMCPEHFSTRHACLDTFFLLNSALQEDCHSHVLSRRLRADYVWTVVQGLRRHRWILHHCFQFDTRVRCLHRPRWHSLPRTGLSHCDSIDRLWGRPCNACGCIKNLDHIILSIAH